MKKLMLAAAFAVALLSTSAQAGDSPAVLRGVSKKQTLTSQQMRQVRGEGLLCGPLINVAACANVKVDVNVHAKVNVPCLVDLNACVNVHANVRVGALVRL
jgi:hypothetical protein